MILVNCYLLEKNFYRRGEIFEFVNKVLLVASFEILADMLTQLSVFDWPEGPSKYTFENCKNLDQCFKR